MGTRHLTCVFKDGKFKVAQYGQWDGYPSVAGETIFNFIRKNYDPERFAKAVDNCRVATEKGIDDLWVDCGAEPGADSVSPGVSYKFTRKYPELSRDTGADILWLIQERGGVYLKLEPEFGAESLFCEWAYVLDLDANRLEVYKGFNTSKTAHGCGKFARFKGSDEKYKPVKLVRSYNISDIMNGNIFIYELIDKYEKDEEE